uniref:Farnesyl pyrophosphate synthetase, putative n=1 Tax=Theileria annulata TaxID=5874 RepID=A0A3B0MWB0_THEAN
MDSSYNLTKDDIHKCNGQLKDFFPKFLELAINELKTYGLSQNVLLYYSYAVQYNLQGGKMLRGTMVLSTVKSLCGTNIPENLMTQTLIVGMYNCNHLKQFIVAWCVELLQTSFLVADDIIDKSTKRRSNTCWYLVPTIGVSNAINDVMFLYTLIYRILFNTMKDSKKFLEIIETFNRVSMTTILGQHLDIYESNSDVLFHDSKEATKLFAEICKNKTSYYSFFLPLKLGMMLSGVELSNLFYSKVESISILIGTLFQAQDDYLDCYGDPDDFGKNGTDIQTRKCSWLLSQALTIASEEQKNLIKENIGHDDNSKVDVVKSIYRELEMDKHFLNYTLYAENKINRYCLVNKLQFSEIDKVENQGKVVGIKTVLKWCLELIINRSK